MEKKGTIWLRFPGGKPKALTLSYDDGVEQDVRLMALMKKHGLKGTFNLNSGLFAPEGTVYPAGTIHRRMSLSQALDLYKDSGMEVAVHGLTHPFLEQLTPAECTREVIADRENLEREFGGIVRGMAYPYGTFSDTVVECLKACGIVYSRTVISSDSFALPTDWLRLEATCHHDDPRLMELAARFVEETPDKTPWNRKPWMFYLWGHSYEFEANGNWDLIEKFAEYTAGKDDIWYATNLEIYDYIEAWHRLVVSADGTRIYNPTAYTLWYSAGWSGTAGQCGCIRPGEEI